MTVALLRWLVFEPRFVWAGTVGTAAVFVVTLHVSATASHGINYGGLVFELLGVLCVAWGLHETVELFQPQLTMWDRIYAWWRRFPFREPDRREVVAQPTTGEVNVEGGTPTLELRAGTPPKLEQRVLELEIEVNRLKHYVFHLQRFAQSEAFERAKADRDEKEQREKEAARLRVLLEDLSVGGLGLEVLGLWWVIVGLIASTVPDDLARLL